MNKDLSLLNADATLALSEDIFKNKKPVQALSKWDEEMSKKKILHFERLGADLERRGLAVQHIIGLLYLQAYAALYSVRHRAARFDRFILATLSGTNAGNI